VTKLPNDGCLADGSAPATTQQLLDHLRSLGIEAPMMEHPRVFTVDEAREQRGHLPGLFTKSLFLRDRKGAMWLVVCLDDREVDLRALPHKIGAKPRLSFGSAERLMKYLGVTAGSVSPLALINDTSHKVRVYIDRALLTGELINLHPLDNAKTVTIARDDLLRFLESIAHPLTALDFD
jgi:Ala-tRNA(Pro) deacylase